jgi:ubiquinone/menaquinone biosynthesis C-methylase UbiE
VSISGAAASSGLFAGRFSQALARPFADFAGLVPGWRVVDVGCGPSALTAVLVRALGPAAVSAVDPSEAYVEAVRARLPEVDVRRAPAEDLPYDEATFDAALAQLVVHFMADPVVGLREMSRVTKPGGVVAACVWDNGGGSGGAYVTGLDEAHRVELGALLERTLGPAPFTVSVSAWSVRAAVPSTGGTP